MGPIEKYLKQVEYNKVLKEDSNMISSKVQDFLDKCDRLKKVLNDDKLFQKEKQKH